MGSPRVALWAACTLVASFVTVESRADLPPPPGQTRVDYTFRVTGSVRDVVIVAFPIYVSGGKHALELELEKEVRPVQGRRAPTKRPCARCWSRRDTLA
jgi:hypothetical protein